MIKLLLSIFLSLTLQTTFSQVLNSEDYDIVLSKDKGKDCKTMFDVLGDAPIDARFGTRFVGDSVFVYHSDPDWFAKIIELKNDGVAIDLVQRAQYPCEDINNFPDSWSHRGYLLPPIYKDQIGKRMTNSNGFIMFFAGKLPNTIKQEGTEANYILLKNKVSCYYSSTVNVDYQGWKLLKMGLYYDTLTREKMQEKYKDLRKTLRFNIPFEKNKSIYNVSDIRPMYDSLKMTDFAISKISIKAYTSVEGTYERNVKLQNQRAKSIVEALQTFQSEKIDSKITASENWVEFLEDIAATGYKEWATLSKDEIKKNLQSPEVLDKLEPVLRTHRKAIIEINLEKRLSYKESKQDELKKYFEHVIQLKNIDEALYLQQIIFHKIERQETPEQFLEELEIPEALAYGRLLINNASFMFEHDYYNIFEAIRTFEELDAIIPNNPKIRYNLCALKIQSFLQTSLIVDMESLKKEIEALRQYKIHENLIQRLLINYHIILSELHLKKRNYPEKDKTIKFIYESYKPLHLNDQDLVNLAKYFSDYSRFDWAREVLQPRINSLDAEEDLIFYFLNLTIYDEEYTSSPPYRATMLNAINGNRARFCELFEPADEGGVSFQLLNDSYLKETFWENCNNP